jgi:hypothetical protein
MWIRASSHGTSLPLIQMKSERGADIVERF